MIGSHYRFRTTGKPRRRVEEYAVLFSIITLLSPFVGDDDVRRLCLEINTCLMIAALIITGRLIQPRTVVFYLLSLLSALIVT